MNDNFSRHFLSPAASRGGRTQDLILGMISKVLYLCATTSSKQLPYSQHFIFILIYEWAKHYTRLKRLSSDKHSTLFGTFVSNEEDEVLWILTNREVNSTVLSKKPQKSATVTISNIFDIFVSQKKASNS